MKTFITLLALAASSTLALAADAKLSDAQIDAAFAKADLDKNGTLSLVEAKRFGITGKFFRLANPDLDSSLDKMEFVAAIEAQFKAANPDNDGTLDAREAAKAGVKNRRVFEAANPDKDGTLDIAEYLAALVAQAR
jgi:EF-hand domain pair